MYIWNGFAASKIFFPYTYMYALGTAARAVDDAFREEDLDGESSQPPSIIPDFFEIMFPETMQVEDGRDMLLSQDDNNHPWDADPNPFDLTSPSEYPSLEECIPQDDHADYFPVHGMNSMNIDGDNPVRNIDISTDVGHPSHPLPIYPAQHTSNLDPSQERWQSIISIIQQIGSENGRIDPLKAEVARLESQIMAFNRFKRYRRLRPVDPLAEKFMIPFHTFDSDDKNFVVTSLAGGHQLRTNGPNRAWDSVQLITELNDIWKTLAKKRRRDGEPNLDDPE